MRTQQRIERQVPTRGRLETGSKHTACHSRRDLLAEGGASARLPKADGDEPLPPFEQRDDISGAEVGPGLQLSRSWEAEESAEGLWERRVI